MSLACPSSIVPNPTAVLVDAVKFVAVSALPVTSPVTLPVNVALSVLAIVVLPLLSKVIHVVPSLSFISLPDTVKSPSICKLPDPSIDATSTKLPVSVPEIPELSCPKNFI